MEELAKAFREMSPSLKVTLRRHPLYDRVPDAKAAKELLTLLGEHQLIVESRNGVIVSIVEPISLAPSEPPGSPLRRVARFEVATMSTDEKVRTILSASNRDDVIEDVGKLVCPVVVRLVDKLEAERSGEYDGQ